MAEFHGYKCDSCGHVIEDPAERTIKRVRFTGPVLQGDYTQDLCRSCLPDDLPTLRPIPRRRSRKQQDASPEQEVDNP